MINKSLILGVDTCGPAGSIALGWVFEDGLELLGEGTIAGGELSVGLVRGIAGLLSAAGFGIEELAGIVAVAGPGSFTGIRVGLAVVKGIAEARRLPVVTLSRLALLAEAGKAERAVLDAHRGQYYCGLYANGLDEHGAREMLLTAGEINAMGGLRGRVAVCEETVAQSLEELCGEPELVRVAAPTAADAIRASLGKWQAGRLADVATLDGYYLRGADAKIAARVG
jgi:tRNA threonylcarbamoyladenosine biosynthesis protein TsaB